MTATTIKEYPIDCTAEEVRGILDGTITQLRRATEPQPPADATDVFAWYEPGIPEPYKAQEGLYCWNPGGLHFIAPSVFGFPGDVLWVRETWRVTGFEPLCQRWRVEYQAGGWADKPGDMPDYFLSGGDGARIRPANEMPQWASRLTLELVEVDVVLNGGWHWSLTFKRI